MNIEKIKEQLNNHLGEQATIRYNLGRNKIAKYDVTIKNIYNHIFTVEIENNKAIKSFSYSDVITKTIKIDYKKIAFWLFLVYN